MRLYPQSKSKNMQNILLFLNKESVVYNGMLKSILLKFNVIFKHENNFKNINELEIFYIKHKIRFIIFLNPYGNLIRLSLYLKIRNNTKMKFIITDRGALPNSWFFDKHGFNADSKSYSSKYWDKPLTKKKELNVIQYINSDINNSISLESQNNRIGAKNLRIKLNIEKNKKILFVPLQRPSDTVIKYFSGNVENINHFLKNILKIQKRLKGEWVVLIKKHPLENIRFFEDKLLYVDDNTHFKDLVELSDSIVLINSGVGVTAMMHQKPVLYFGNAFYSHNLINKEIKTVEEAIFYLKNPFEVNFEKVKRFISYLIEDFYSFGNFTTKERIEEDGSKRTIATKIDFYQIKGLSRKSEKNTLLVSDIKFWKADLGNRQRILRLIQYLIYDLDLKILFLGKTTKQDQKDLKQLNLFDLIDEIDTIKLKINDIKKTKETKIKCLEKFYNHNYKCKFNEYLVKNKFDNIIVEYIRLDYLVNDLHDNYTTIIDTHDLMSLRNISYLKNGDKHHIVISEEEEYKLLSKYNYILAIQKNEYNLLNENIKKEKNLLVYHAVDIQTKYLSKKIFKNIVFISGPANRKHIIWFIENIWKYFLDETGLTLNIYGSVCKNLQQYKKIKNIVLHGYIKDLNSIYSSADLVINPVLYGGGLKIKNIETLANGVPLITTDEGANGIEDGINYSFLLANSVDEWLEAILSIKLSKELRKKLSKNSIRYSKEYFSDNNCYAKVVDALRG